MVTRLDSLRWKTNLVSNIQRWVHCPWLTMEKICMAHRYIYITGVFVLRSCLMMEVDIYDYRIILKY